jgi:putative oxidoreductase
MNRYLHPISRLLISAIFILSGVNKIIGFSGTSDFLAKLGWPAPALWVTLAVIFELAGGLALLFGFKARLASCALIIFLLAATIFVHGRLYSDATEPGEKQNQMVNILKNVAILGGLLKFYTDGAGYYAVERDPAV